MKKTPPTGRPPHDPGIGVAWIGHSLRIRRLAVGMRIKDLADKMSVGTTTVSRWEATSDGGGNAPTNNQVTALAELLGCERADFGKEPTVS